jgi:hypothetical protein
MRDEPNLPNAWSLKQNVRTKLFELDDERGLLMIVGDIF